MQLIHAFVHHQRGNLVEASVAYEEAFRSPTRYPTVYHWYSRLLGDLGFLEESLEQAGIARSMEPASQILNSRLAIASLWMNDMENAERYFEIANEIGVGVPDHQLGMAMFYMRRGEIDAAREAVRLAFRMAQRPTEWVDDVFDSLKDPSNAELRAAAIDTLDTATRDGEIPPYVVLVSWVLFGEIDRAMDVALAEAADHGAIYEMEIVFVEEFAEFRRHPDFPKLMDSLGITRLWQSAGCTFAAGELQCPST